MLNEKTAKIMGWKKSRDGWSHMIRTPDKKLAFLYFENEAASKQTVSGLIASEE